MLGSYTLSIGFSGNGPATVTIQVTHPDFVTGGKDVTATKNQTTIADFVLTAKHPTITTWSPTSATVAVGGSTIFTITVSDMVTPGSQRTAPTGTVTFSPAVGVTFNPTPSCILTTASGSSSTCSVTVTGSSATNSPYTLTAQYSNDATHKTSVGTATLTVSSGPTKLATSVNGGTNPT